MHITALCCTYLRSHLLGNILECWNRQDYPPEERELIILDDAGEYLDQHGDNWKLISIPMRFPSLGEKRNAIASMASTRTDAYCIWDDDDLYLPWALSACHWALERAPLSRPSIVLYPDPQEPVPRQYIRHKTGGLYHGGWAYTRDAFNLVGGYSKKNNGEDQEMLGRMLAAGVRTVDPLQEYPPFYVYRDKVNSYHLSWSGPKGYEDLGRRKHNGFKRQLVADWPCDYAVIPVHHELRERPF